MIGAADAHVTAAAQAVLSAVRARLDEADRALVALESDIAARRSRLVFAAAARSARRARLALAVAALLAVVVVILVLAR